MNELIKVGELKTQMTSLEIAELTGKEHKTVMRDIRTLEEQVSQIDGYKFVLTYYEDSIGRKQPMYELGKKECLLLASGYDTVLRAKIINRWEELEMAAKNQFKVPTSFREALLLAAEQQGVIEEQQKRIDIMKPKEEFFDAVADSKDAIPMLEVAKVLNIKGMGRNNLFEFLREQKILMRNNLPYEKYVDRGYFRVIEQKYTKNYEECINFKTLVYQRGIDFIRKTVNEHLNKK